jgi:ribose transport system ATP-binding protein
MTPAEGAERTQKELAVRAVDLSVTFGAVKAIQGLTLDITKGEIHGLIGHNGSGKSTFAKVLAGVYSPSAGHVEAFGEVLPSSVGRPSQRAGRVVVVPQDLGLVPSMSVVDNFKVNRYRRGLINWRVERQATRAALEALGADVDPRQPVHTLNSSERVLLSVARALADLSSGGSGSKTDEAVLVLDEPTSSLPHDSVETLLATIRTINSQLGVTIILVSHNPREILAVSHRVSALKNGQSIGTFVTSALSFRGLAELMAGQALEGLGKPPSRAATPPASVARADDRGREEAEGGRVTIQNLAGGRLRGVSLDVSPGEIVAFTGLVGSGYEDLPYILVGAIPKAGGEISVNGVPYTRPSPGRWRRSGSMFLPSDRQRTSAVQRATVRENVTLGELGSFVRAGFLRRGLEANEVRAVLRRRRIEPADPERAFFALSGGQQQKALIGRCLLLHRRVLMIHEPTVAIDVGARDEIHKALQDVAAEGTAVLIVSCQYEELPVMCDRVITVISGQVSGRLSGEELTEANILTSCYGG